MLTMLGGGSNNNSNNEFYVSGDESDEVDCAAAAADLSLGSSRKKRKAEVDAVASSSTIACSIIPPDSKVFCAGQEALLRRLARTTLDHCRKGMPGYVPVFDAEVAVASTQFAPCDLLLVGDILEAAGLIEILPADGAAGKEGKRKWVPRAADGDEPTDATILAMESEIASLESTERSLDAYCRYMENVLEKEARAAAEKDLLYVNAGDITGLDIFKDKQVVVVRAPKGAVMSMLDPDSQGAKAAKDLRYQACIKGGKRSRGIEVRRLTDDDDTCVHK